MKKGNIFFVSLVCIAALAGNAFCADKNNNTESKINSIIVDQEEMQNLNKVLNEEKNQQVSNSVLEQVSAKLAKVKKQYPASAGDIDRAFAAIQEIVSRGGGGRLDFLAQNYVTPLEGDLSPALVSLKNQNTGAFYATMNIIDVVYPTQRGNSSLSNVLDFVNGYLPFDNSKIKDTDNLIDSLTAEPYSDALWLFGYFQKQEPTLQTPSIIEKNFKCVVSRYNSKDFGSKVWAQNAEGCLEDFENILATIKILKPSLYDKVIGIMNRKYLASNGKRLSIAEMKNLVNATLKNYIVADTGLVQDPRGILDSMTAYE